MRGPRTAFELEEPGTLAGGFPSLPERGSAGQPLPLRAQGRARLPKGRAFPAAPEFGEAADAMGADKEPGVVAETRVRSVEPWATVPGARAADVLSGAMPFLLSSEAPKGSGRSQ